MILIRRFTQISRCQVYIWRGLFVERHIFLGKKCYCSHYLGRDGMLVKGIDAKLCTLSPRGAVSSGTIYYTLFGISCFHVFSDTPTKAPIWWNNSACKILSSLVGVTATLLLCTWKLFGGDLCFVFNNELDIDWHTKQQHKNCGLSVDTLYLSIYNLWLEISRSNRSYSKSNNTNPW